MGAFGAHHIHFTKGMPSMQAVDLAIPATDADILEGMCIYEDPVSGGWKKGCPRGRLPYVTGSEQFPSALDVARRTFAGGYNGQEMGRGNMGGVSLTNAVEFDTTEYVGAIAGKYVFGDTDGKFKAATSLATQQIAGYCRSVFTDSDGDSVARIVAIPSPNPEIDKPALEELSSQTSASSAST
jgi:hypothetical protein